MFKNYYISGNTIKTQTSGHHSVRDANKKLMKRQKLHHNKKP